ncbi:MAG: adenylate/guanylate cyclase domain-containing protein [Gammaproteobacteria bacterium]|nr:adenylate/guanylate cyclase domain-containing protein [Gammaproteobacteria bacterium]
MQDAEARRLRKLQLAAGAAMVLLALVFCLTPWGEALDGFAADTLFLLRGAEQAPDNLVIVAIDEPSFAEISAQWPWPRSLHARLLEQLFAAGATAVGVDILFPEQSTEAEDAALAQALRKHRRVVLAADVNVVEESAFSRQTLVLPAAVLVDQDTLIGAINLPLERDGFVRNQLLRPGEQPSLALLLAQLTRGADCCADARRVAAQGKRIRLNFPGPSRTVKTVSYYQALQPDRYLPDGFFTGKTVLVGLATQSAADPRGKADHFSTPFTRQRGVRVAGVEIHATAVANLLDGSFIRTFANLHMLPPGLMIGLLVAFLLVRARPVAGALLVIVLAATTGAAGYWLFSTNQVYMPPLPLILPLFAAYLLNPFFHYFAEVREKRFIHKTFDAYLNPSVVKALAERPEMLRPGGKTVHGSVLFLDVADFTTLSENYQPEVLIQIINRFLGAMTEIVMRNEGMIDKFIGDAVMAAWGAPLQQSDHAERACRAALEMEVAMVEIAACEETLTGARLQARIGINSGEMLAGNIGGTRRFDYTVHGNEVNTASRIEGVNKLYGTHLMIGENTARIVADQFVLRQVDRVLLKGKHIPIDIFELQADAASRDAARERCNALYAQARDCYRQRQWEAAMRLFEQAADVRPADGPSLTMADRCREYQQAPPPADWDGAFAVTTK